MMVELSGPGGGNREDQGKDGEEPMSTLRIRMAKMPADPQAFVDELAGILGMPSEKFENAVFIKYARNEDGSDPTEPGSEPGRIEDIKILPRRPDISE